ncbi:MAG: ribonuclease R [Proteobacteria bacterium]|nr:MAG: ribonuclease R [Pseudomonadota bacterium]
MKYKDPHKAREAENYERPIASRELILKVLSDSSTPLEFADLSGQLAIEEPELRDALKYRLRAMERDGQIIFNRRRQYLPVSKADLISGRISGHPDGFGFLIPDDGSDDLFLHGKQMRKLMHGDRALCSVTGIDKKGRREGAVVEVLERNTEHVVGRYFVRGGIGFVEPDNKRIAADVLIPPGNGGKAKHGQIVRAALVEQPNTRQLAIGKIVEILGEHMAPGMEIDIALRSHDLPHVFNEEVREETLKLGDDVTEDDKLGRVDYRHIPLVTIDGEDSRDFDDAVYVERKGDNWKLIVAIADVSHYVPIGSSLDQEAWNRGTSVYFPEQVIPMFPEEISNGLCSLNPQVDRLCMVCEAIIDPDGDILSYEFKEGVMHSAARLTYTDVAAVLVDEDEALCEQYSALLPHLEALYDLYHALRHARDMRGSIDFETTETKIEFGKDRKIKSIKPTERNDAHKIIEECMIAANVCAARYLKKHRMPSLYRVHARPDTESLDKVREFLGGIGLNLGGGAEPEPKDYAKLLASVQDRADAGLIQTILLRSLPRAIYSPVNPDKPEATRHFGLAQKDYAHFTSPIRRYPDLLVHRAIRHLIRGGNAADYAYSLSDMSALGEHCSMTERRADDATRDVLAWLKAEYMLNKVGEVFDGFITAVTGFGLFVELADIYVEGLVHVTSLKSDYYRFDPVLHRLTGESSGRSFRLGDPITVQVARVDLDDRKIDFTLPGAPDSNGKRPPKKKKKAKNASEVKSRKKSPKRKKRKS